MALPLRKYGSLRPQIAARILPGGLRVDQTEPVLFNRTCRACSVPGVDGYTGYSACAEAFDAYMTSIEAAAAIVALEEWRGQFE